MKRYTWRAVFQAVISISAFICFPHPTLAAEPVPSSGAEQRPWTETHLLLSPSMQESIDRTNEFLDTQTPLLSEKLDQLKWMGYLDRRTKTDIESTIADAKQSMSGLEVKEKSGRMDAGRARTIAYDLGMAGDVLAKQSEKITANLTGTNEQAPAAGNGRQAPVQQQMEIAEILSTMSRHLHETARAIVANLK